jgi:hypothetical protein
MQSVIFNNSMKLSRGRRSKLTSDLFNAHDSALGKTNALCNHFKHFDSFGLLSELDSVQDKFSHETYECLTKNFTDITIDASQAKSESNFDCEKYLNIIKENKLNSFLSEDGAECSHSKLT